MHCPFISDSSLDHSILVFITLGLSCKSLLSNFNPFYEKLNFPEPPYEAFPTALPHLLLCQTPFVLTQIDEQSLAGMVSI